MSEEPRRNMYLQGLLIATIASGYIFGPMILIGGLGWWLGRRYENIFITLAALFVALVVSNILIFVRTGKDMKRIQKMWPQSEKNQKE